MNQINVYIIRLTSPPLEKIYIPEKIMVLRSPKLYLKFVKDFKFKVIRQLSKCIPCLSSLNGKICGKLPKSGKMAH